MSSNFNISGALRKFLRHLRRKCLLEPVIRLDKIRYFLLHIHRFICIYTWFYYQNLYVTTTDMLKICTVELLISLKMFLKEIQTFNNTFYSSPGSFSSSQKVACISEPFKNLKKAETSESNNYSTRRREKSLFVQAQYGLLVFSSIMILCLNCTTERRIRFTFLMGIFQSGRSRTKKE